jgi:hypothetical protein
MIFFFLQSFIEIQKGFVFNLVLFKLHQNPTSGTRKKNQDLWPPLLCVSKLELFCGEVSKICAKKI